MGLRNQFINNLVFPSWACAAGLNNHNISLHLCICIRIPVDLREHLELHLLCDPISDLIEISIQQLQNFCSLYLRLLSYGSPETCKNLCQVKLHNGPVMQHLGVCGITSWSVTVHQILQYDSVVNMSGYRYCVSDGKCRRSDRINALFSYSTSCM